ncbi:TIGR04282 family arsenosugar biosynthesis glycosyltransferase [Crocosphaera sp. XPORK-15E]|uniref:TIGR04282 family arsenosugar biosynthesis glycosyltransferase n=1 Tax=Crocosphaera sp. XPORK-15E TaxID=3110247 RepID=UPI002B1FD948|nr:TIGR04282 family arsenosugar biosynthesis glycosyltransferase [Crocosphaera sp. XPORK-15E]MEA5536323.1 TIGR04282 family arsenosugar biosynthesis glycosyltransferase [Crocosphaera sp. XPORK-15E]
MIKKFIVRAEALNNYTLIIFTRYPEPGKTKTRLIPVLGAEGAANLQQKLTEHTLKEAKKLLNYLAISIYYTGKNKQLMQAWLGDDLTYYSQASGDLGNRMNSAFAESFKLGFSKVVIIGIDCPDLNINILKSAFNYLENNDLVLGEAADGGYYLIGLKKVIPELFKDIAWGTSQVLLMTKNIADQLNLSYHLLPILSDIDRPEDLQIWEKY